MNSDNMQHGVNWQGENLAGWDVSEKLDGCRAFWDGRTLWTRQGCKISAPDWFLSQLPACVRLDGEIWAGRGKFTPARLAVQYGYDHFTTEIKFVVFDAPDAAGDWRTRMSFADQFQTANVLTVERQQFGCMADLQSHFLTVKRDGGEGLMARKPGMIYKTERTNELLKIKAWR